MGQRLGPPGGQRLRPRVPKEDGALRTWDRPTQPAAGTTEAYCRAVGIPFIAEALAWEEGERSEVSWYGEGTGPWHDNLRASTGIQKPKTEYPPIEDDPRLVEFYERALPLYEDMLAHAVRPA